jgi:hypothetical protein
LRKIAPFGLADIVDVNNFKAGEPTSCIAFLLPQFSFRLYKLFLVLPLISFNTPV